METLALVPLAPRGGLCPRCETPFELEDLRLTGWRLLMEGDCAHCGHHYLQDLPTGHGLVYPSSIDVTTGQAHGRWFEAELLDGWRAPDNAPVALRVTRHRDVSDAVLLPCLDPVYGHALLRLLNAQAHLDAGRDVVVLVPAAIAHLVPDGVAERWVVEEPLGRLRGWLSDLDRRLHAETERFKRLALAAGFPHPHPSTFDLARFTGTIEAKRHGEPSVLLSIREDRTWGGSVREQRRHFEATLEPLRAALPELGAVAVGVAPPGAAPAGALDRTSPAPTADDERGWLAAAAGADLVIGVHGSNLLLPSGLARATLELLPEDRWTNALQATIVAARDPLVALFEHRTLYGSPDLSDVAPRTVAAIAESMLVGAARFREYFAGPAAGLGDTGALEPPLGPKGSRWLAVSADDQPPRRGLLRRR